MSSSVFRFREPRASRYQIEPVQPVTLRAQAKPAWLRAHQVTHPDVPVDLGDRIVLELEPTADLDSLLQGRPLQPARTVAPRVFIVQAPDAWTAAAQAQELASLPGVKVSCPVMRRQIKPFSRYARPPNDPYFTNQWYLEYRDASTGKSLGGDLNVRAAWPWTQGQGVVIAVADDGVDLSHPDLSPQPVPGLQYDFTTGSTNVLNLRIDSEHGTPVAGLALAVANNHIGVAGVAPRAKLASWIIFQGSNLFVSDEQLMDMFQYHSNEVSVQNHSWGDAVSQQIPLSRLADLGIEHAVTKGRGGLGEVLVRAGGNNRTGDGVFTFGGGNANDDGYLADPRVIAVGAVRQDGKVARYSSPGANLLVVAPSGDVSPQEDHCLSNAPNLFTTDRVGALGLNQGTYSNSDLADYAFGANGFNGTSASTPLISGVCALILSANTNLTYRDVQQILIFSSRLTDFSDTDIATNGAGFIVSHDLGFGIPDAGEAVRLAREWKNRPAPVEVTFTATNTAAIPDLGLRVLVTGQNVPADLLSIVASPSVGIHPDNGTAWMPLVDVGLATNIITQDLHGEAALIQRGVNYFCEKLDFAEQAGAALAIVYSNCDATARIFMDGTLYNRVPAVFLDQNDGEALRDYLRQDPSAQVRIQLVATNYTFNVTNTLICEHVGLLVDSDHSSRGDLRITLTSPQGTTSVMQTLNSDTSPGPQDWTYYSTHHFYESSAGTWTVQISDEDTGGTGNVKKVGLLLQGVPITDTDHDGLDDNWERKYFGNLSAGPRDDPDGDGESNAREQILHTDPLKIDVPFRLDLSPWNRQLARVSWPGNPGLIYQVWEGDRLAEPMTQVTKVPAVLPVTEWFTPITNFRQHFFRVVGVPKTSAAIRLQGAVPNGS